MKAIPKVSRPTTRDTEDVKKQAFFRHIQWEELLHRRVPPPFVALSTVYFMEDLSKFDEEFTSEKAQLTPSKEPRPVTVQNQNLFNDFMTGADSNRSPVREAHPAYEYGVAQKTRHTGSGEHARDNHC